MDTCKKRRINNCKAQNNKQKNAEAEYKEKNFTLRKEKENKKMKNTELKRMNIEEMDQVNGGFYLLDVGKAIVNTIDSVIPRVALNEAVNKVKGTCIKAGVDAARVIV